MLPAPSLIEATLTTPVILSKNVSEANCETISFTIKLTGVANKHTQTILTGVELPLHDDYLNNLEYFFIYVVNGIVCQRVPFMS